MTKIIGKIESLKALKKELNKKDIYIFNSVSDINEFIREYKNKKNTLLKNTENKILEEIKSIRIKIDNRNKKIEELPSLLKHDIESIGIDIKRLANIKTNFITKHIFKYKLRKKERKRYYLIENFDYIVSNQQQNIKNIISNLNSKISYLTENKGKEIKKRSETQIYELNYIKNTIDKLYPLIAGAIGENMVVKELSKLSDDYVLFNDFHLEFDPPIYNKKTKDRIFSIQIDHLLVARSGIFLLETKNWSKSSIKSFDLRSPIDQILRTSYALFVFLNNLQDFEFTNSHHWGEKKIPIKNLLVMINNKPKNEFKFVKVLKLKELNGFIEYFEPIFKKNELKNIVNILTRFMH